MLAGKPGLLHLHMGTGGSRRGGAVAGSGAGAAGNGCPQRMPFQTLVDAVEGSDVPVRVAAASPTVFGGSGSVPCGVRDMAGHLQPCAKACCFSVLGVVLGSTDMMAWCSLVSVPLMKKF